MQEFMIMLTILTQLSYIVLAELGTPCWKFQLGTYLCMHDVLAFFPNLRGPPEV